MFKLKRKLNKDLQNKVGFLCKTERSKLYFTLVLGFLYK